MTLRVAIACACLVSMCFLGVAAAAAAEEAVEVRGRLMFRGNEKPLAGATLRFVPEDPAAALVSAVTDAQGEFVVERVTLGTYTVEIENAEGQVVRAFEARPVDGSRRIVLELARSDRVRSSTTVEVGPAGPTASVVRESMRSRRFWKQFAIFWGVTIATGAAVY